MPKLSVSFIYLLNAVMKNSTALTRDEQLETRKNSEGVF